MANPLEATNAAPTPRTLVLCFDGTMDQYDNFNTNVVKFFSLLKKDNENEQLCYYQPGIGTYFNPGVVAPLFEWCAKMLDYAIAWYLDAHIMDGYRFLMQNYRAGDKICLFGFSRGAYTARALAGFLHKVGLLPRDNQEQILLAYKLYKRTDAAGLLLCKGYKQTYCRDVNIEFIGVWDTVTGVGLLSDKTLPFVTSNTAIRTFRHALSLDENLQRRCRFSPNIYHKPAPNLEGARDDPEHATPVLRQDGDTKLCLQLPKRRRPHFMKGDKLPLEQLEYGEPCNALEVWFAGCHSDVGGGAVANDNPLSLSNISLRWMVREVLSSQCGILFESTALARHNIPTYPPIKSTPNLPTPPSSSDQSDAIQPLDDELARNPLWWILEIIALPCAWQDADGIWHKKFRINLGRGRTIYAHEPKFHSSVQLRMADKTLKYQPKATWEKGKEKYVE